jgi:hypothetical protein
MCRRLVREPPARLPQHDGGRPLYRGVTSGCLGVILGNT